MEVFTRKIGIVSASVSVAIAIIGLLYRSTVYWLIPVAPGEPYGFGDVLDFGFAVILIFSVGLTVIISLLLMVLWKRKNKKTALNIWVVSVVATVVYYLLYPILPRLV